MAIEPKGRLTPRIGEAVRDAMEIQRQLMERHKDSDIVHGVLESKFETLERTSTERFEEIRQATAEQTTLLRQILDQAIRTNGRVGLLEKYVGEDETKGLRGDTADLKTAKVRALQTITVAGLVITAVMWAFGDDIRQRGVLNPTPSEIAKQVDAVIEKRVQASALKPAQP